MQPHSALFFEGIIRLAMIHASESAIRFVSETPEMHLSAPVQDFIRQEMGRPSKNCSTMSPRDCARCPD